MNLSDKKCVPCEGGLSPLTADDVLPYLKNTRNWLADQDNKSITRKIII